MTLYRRPDPIPRSSNKSGSAEGLQPVREHHQDLNSLAARRIFMAIASKTWGHPGTLPKEDELGAQLGVSRTVVREAVKSLASKAIVETRRRRGTVILEADHWNMVDGEIIDWMSESDMFPRLGEDLMACLSLTQPALAAIAADRANTGRLTQLADKIGKARTKADAVSAALDFHLEIAYLAGNPFLRSLTLNAIEGLKLHEREAFESFLNGIATSSYAAIASAIQSGQAEKADRLLTRLFAKEMADAEMNSAMAHN